MVFGTSGSEVYAKVTNISAVDAYQCAATMAFSDTCHSTSLTGNSTSLTGFDTFFNIFHCFLFYKK
jgi:hypothetical protein